MSQENLVSGLVQLGNFLRCFLVKKVEEQTNAERELQGVLEKSKTENPWFTLRNQKFALQQWADLLHQKPLSDWLSSYQTVKEPKNIGLILAGNIPLVGFHDVIATVLSGNLPLIKLSSKDRLLLPFLLKKWEEFSGKALHYKWVEKLENFDAVIATGSNNTARYLEYYFKEYPHIIRKNRTSVALLSGEETDEDIQNLGEDIFSYYGMGCRNVTQLLIPQDFELDLLFKNFISHQNIINHHQYANNYDYNKALYLLNQEVFWDNNFVMLKESEQLFSPLSVVYFKRYQELDGVKQFLSKNKENIQCIVNERVIGIPDSVDFGTSQKPGLATYADHIDTLKFLEDI